METDPFGGWHHHGQGCLLSVGLWCCYIGVWWWLLWRKQHEYAKNKCNNDKTISACYNRMRETKIMKEASIKYRFWVPPWWACLHGWWEVQHLPLPWSQCVIDGCLSHRRCEACSCSLGLVWSQFEVFCGCLWLYCYYIRFSMLNKKNHSSKI